MGDEVIDMDARLELAEMRVKIANLQAGQTDLLTQVRSMNGTLQTINTTLSEAKGGWKTLLWLGGASGALGAALAHLAHTIPLPK